MTRSDHTEGPVERGEASSKAVYPAAASATWPLYDAKARFSEVVRRARSDGPQHITVHGREEAVVITADEFRRLRGDKSGEALIAALQASPHRNARIEPTRSRMPVRGVAL